MKKTGSVTVTPEQFKSKVVSPLYFLNRRMVLAALSAVTATSSNKEAKSASSFSADVPRYAPENLSHQDYLNVFSQLSENLTRCLMILLSTKAIWAIFH